MKVLIHYTETLDGFKPICGKKSKTYHHGWEANIWKSWALVTCRRCLEKRVI